MLFDFPRSATVMHAPSHAKKALRALAHPVTPIWLRLPSQELAHLTLRA